MVLTLFYLKKYQTMKTANLNRIEEKPIMSNDETPGKLQDFYKDNWRKIYYLNTNQYDEVEGRNYRHTNPIVRDIKRVSYFSTKEMDDDGTPKANWRKNIDRIVIDCDEGIAKSLPVIQLVLDKLQCEYWVIAGTDRPNKPYDSGSIVIMFNPVDGELIRDHFKLLVKCLNINLGDVRNIGYMHKNPIWIHVRTFEKYGNIIISFESLFNAIFNHFNKSENDVEEIYDYMVKDAYTNDLIDELAKEHPKRSRALKLYYRSHRDPDLKLQLDNLINNGEKEMLSPAQYAKYLLLHEFFFENPKYNKIIIRPVDLRTRYEMSEKKEAYIYKKIRKNFNVWKVSDNELRLLGFSEIQISNISTIKNMGRMNGQINRAINSKKAIDRITELVCIKNEFGLSVDEETELNNLYCRNKKKSKSKKIINSRQVTIDRVYNFDFIDSFDCCYIPLIQTRRELTDDTKSNISNKSLIDNNLNDKKKKVRNDRGKTRTTLYYNETLNLTITKEEFVRDYCGGVCSKSHISRKAYKFGFIPKRIYDMQQQDKMNKPQDEPMLLSLEEIKSRILDDTEDYFNYELSVYEGTDEKIKAMNLSNELYRHIFDNLDTFKCFNDFECLFGSNKFKMIDVPSGACSYIRFLFNSVIKPLRDNKHLVNWKS
jgi:hypothetical protein